MLILRALVKAIKLLNSETSAASLAAAVMLGTLMGLVPFLTLQCLLVLAIVLFCRVNLTATMISLGIFKLIGLALAGTFDSLGVALLESPGLYGLWSALYHSPLSACRTHEATTLGATLVALLLLAPVFFGTRSAIRAYRRKASDRWTKRAAMGGGGASWFRRIYTWVDSPFGGP